MRGAAKRMRRFTRAGFALAPLLYSMPLACMPTQHEAEAPSEAPEKSSLDLIALNGFSISGNDETQSSLFQAASLTYRNRSGAAGFVTYHDLADLFATDGRLSIELSASDGFSPISESIASLIPDSKKLADSSDGLDTGNRPIVTRVLVDQLAIDLSSPGTQLLLEADHARYDIDSETLVLYGGIVVRTSYGDEIRATRAVLTRDHDGMYLPVGYTRDGRKELGSAFAALNDQGELSTTRGGERISYEDLIEKREQIVLHHFADRAPPALRPLLIAILAGMDLNRL